MRHHPLHPLLIAALACLVGCGSSTEEGFSDSCPTIAELPVPTGAFRTDEWRARGTNGPLEGGDAATDALVVAIHRAEKTVTVDRSRATMTVAYTLDGKRIVERYRIQPSR